MSPGNPTCVLNLDGVWVMDRELSSDPDAILRLQGVNWLVRGTYKFVTVYLNTTEYATVEHEKAPPTLHIDTIHTPTGGYIGITEKRTLDGEPHSHGDYIFGNLSISSQLVGGVEDPDGKVRPDIHMQTENFGKEALRFLRGEISGDGTAMEGFLVEESVGGDLPGDHGRWVHSVSVNKERRCTIEQVWGFESIEGERCHTHRVVVSRDGQYELARFIYRLCL